MNEFLHYSILGIMTVQTYLIIAAIDLFLQCWLSKKHRHFSNRVARALAWPILIVVLIIIFVLASFVGLYEIMSKAKRK
ncbi:hypothetical protein pEaSNUABM27_00010 [Erwinia phage pEa_SNUABM_27]|nr:hypothetical protein pEaSNUABM27_00010 [Erwinia phage pEa_SNUABM_27]